MQRVIVTGAHGFLGARICAFLEREGWSVTALSHDKLEVGDPLSVRRELYAARPEAVIHCAAVSDTGYTQRHPEEAYAAGVKGSANVASVCAELKCKLLYMSSDQVYNGCARQGPLRETEPLTPQTVYGVQKRETEQRVQELWPQAVGLRLSWMYDFPRYGMKTNSNLLCNLLGAAMRGETLSFAAQEVRGVTWAWEVVRAVPALLTLPGGVYNAGSAAMGTAYETALFAARALGCQTPERLVRADTERYGQQGRNLSMDCSALQKEGISFSSTGAGVLSCLKAYGWRA